MNIFIDLDDTLIRSVYDSDLRVGDNISGFTSHKFDDGLVWSQKRIFTDSLLEYCRTIDPESKMLTASTSDWAYHWNETFELGFKESNIYSRHDYSVEQIFTGPYGYNGVGIKWNGKTLNIDRNDGLIIDNNSASNPHARDKMSFVFNKFCPLNWITISEDDGDQYVLRDVKDRISKILNRQINNE